MLKVTKNSRVKFFVDPPRNPNRYLNHTFVEYQRKYHQINLFKNSESRILPTNITFCSKKDRANNFDYVQEIGTLDLNFHLKGLDADIFSTDRKFTQGFFEMAFMFSMYELQLDLINDDVDEEGNMFYYHERHREMMKTWGQERSRLCHKLGQVFKMLSKYSEYYKPKNIMDEILKLQVAMYTNSSGWSNFKPVPGPIDDISFEILELKTSDNFRFNLPEIFQLSRPSRTKFSVFKENEDIYDRATTFQHWMSDFALRADEIVYSSRLFGVTIDDLSSAQAITVSQQVNFDSACIRLDFDSDLIKQSSPGIEKGLSMALKIPKFYDGIFDRPQVKMFPREKLRMESSEMARLVEQAQSKNNLERVSRISFDAGYNYYYPS